MIHICPSLSFLWGGSHLLRHAESPQAEIKPMSSVVKAQSLYHWTTSSPLPKSNLIPFYCPSNP